MRAERASEYGPRGAIVVSRSTARAYRAARAASAPRPELGRDDRDVVPAAVVAARAADVHGGDADVAPGGVEDVRPVARAVHPAADRLGGGDVRGAPGEVLAGAPGGVAGPRPVPADPGAEGRPPGGAPGREELVGEVAGGAHR